jgi:hypothetical protein
MNKDIGEFIAMMVKQTSQQAEFWRRISIKYVSGNLTASELEQLEKLL